MKVGDVCTEDCEKEQLQILDGLLYAATAGGSNCVIQDASYTLSDASEPSARLLLAADGDHVVVALIGMRMAVVDSPVTLQIPAGTVKYVYLRAMEDIDSDPAACEIAALSERTDSSGMILLATVDYTGSHAVLDTETGKLYLTAIQAHIIDNEDPHGETLNQTHLNVGGNPVHGCVYRQVVTAGPAGVPLEITELTPLFASAMSPDPAVGDVTFTIADGTVTVRNSGSAGVEITVRIEG